MNLAAPAHTPNLTRLVRELPNTVPRNRRVFQAFKKYGEFTDKQAREALAWGTPPEIRIGPLGPTTWGHTPDTANHFTLNEIIIGQFEDLCWATRNVADPYVTQDWERKLRRQEWQRLLERAELSIEALILHEAVHWGDGQAYEGSNADKSLHERAAARQAGFGDRGFQFTAAAYGNRLPFKKDGDGLRFTDHEILYWMGTVKLDANLYAAWRPLSTRGPGPLRPPALSR
jgi:hypothetical protein